MAETWYFEMVEPSNALNVLHDLMGEILRSIFTIGFNFLFLSDNAPGLYRQTR